jgi:hypothetical protein
MLGLCLVEVSPHPQGMPLPAFLSPVDLPPLEQTHVAHGSSFRLD